MHSHWAGRFFRRCRKIHLCLIWCQQASKSIASLGASFAASAEDDRPTTSEICDVDRPRLRDRFRRGSSRRSYDPSTYERINSLYLAFRKLLISSGHITLSVLFQEPESQR